MKRSALDVIACPACHGRLAFTGDAADPVRTGSLHCPGCGCDYPIVNGIPHFVQPEQLTGLNRRFARMYNWFSWGYRAFSKAAFAFIGMTEERGRREVLDRLEPRCGRTLEISIGPGVNLPYLISRPDVGEVYGLDISLGQLQRCQSYLLRKRWEVDLFLGNGEQLPFGDGTFEAVFHIGGINFFNDKQKAIEEMIRVAAPGTRILICDESEKGARGYEKTIPGFKRNFEGKRATVTPPVDLVPPQMREVRVFDVWKGWMYCLEFRKQ